MGSSANYPEIKITPEMIAAGASVIYGMELSMASPEYYAARIFSETVAALPQSQPVSADWTADNVFADPGEVK